MNIMLELIIKTLKCNILVNYKDGAVIIFFF